MWIFFPYPKQEKENLHKDYCSSLFACPHHVLQVNFWIKAWPLYIHSPCLEPRPVDELSHHCILSVHLYLVCHALWHVSLSLSGARIVSGDLLTPSQSPHSPQPCVCCSRLILLSRRPTGVWMCGSFLPLPIPLHTRYRLLPKYTAGRAQKRSGEARNPQKVFLSLVL
jgi:hypothetical protein